MVGRTLGMSKCGGLCRVVGVLGVCWKCFGTSERELTVFYKRTFHSIESQEFDPHRQSKIDLLKYG